MKIAKNIFTICIMIIILFITNGICCGKVEATTLYPIQSVDLYSKGEIDGFTYKGISIGVQFVVYKKDGVEYPAYCLDRNKMGVDTNFSYSVSIEEAVSDSAIWRAVNYGYPFYTAKELGCQTDGEAFAATKMAVYDAMYNYNWKDFKAINKTGERIIKAAEKISQKARNSKETKITPILDIKKINEDWEVDNIDKSCISLSYEVHTNAESPKYKVTMEDDLIGAKITNKENKEQSEFKKGEIFKLAVPISELEKKGLIQLHITADMKTRPILYGKAVNNPGMQDYALAAGDYEYEKVNLEEMYPENKTKIVITKLDKETQKELQGAKFNIYNDKKELIYKGVSTNKQGKAILEEVMPGKYYIEEIQSPDGYTPYKNLIEIDVKLNQEYKVVVNNYKKPKPQEKEVEPNEQTVTGEKQIALPRTGF